MGQPLKLIGASAFRSFRNLWMLEELGVPYAHEAARPRAREAFDDRGRAVDELGVDVTHLVILVPGGSGRGRWRRRRADDSDLCRRPPSPLLRPRLRPMGPGRAKKFWPGKPVLIDRWDASPGTVQKAPTRYRLRPLVLAP